VPTTTTVINNNSKKRKKKTNPFFQGTDKEIKKKYSIIRQLKIKQQQLQSHQQKEN
jgi:hypothetical protein